MNSSKRKAIREVCRYLDSAVTEILLNLDDNDAEKLCEIRIKAGLPVILIFTDSRRFITQSKRFTQIYSDNLLTVSANELERIFLSMCEYSVHSHMQSLSNGYITLHNGSRVGVYGTAVTENGKISAVKNIKGLNIRIPGDFFGCSSKIISHCFGDCSSNVLICGPPSSGKTTILKDLCRELSDSCLKKVSVIDERCELSGSYLGFNTDVLIDYPKADGIEIAVRTLSPEIIVFDEIGKADEVKSVIESLNSGVSFVTTIHCNEENELYFKQQFQLLRQVNAVDYCVFLGNNFSINNIKKVRTNEICGTDNVGNKLCNVRSIHCVQV